MYDFKTVKNIPFQHYFDVLDSHSGHNITKPSKYGGPILVTYEYIKSNLNINYIVVFCITIRHI